MPSLARSERQRLCDTALVVGPDAPTLSGEWTVRDLLAHLVVRDSDPVGAPGIVLPPLAFLTERRMHDVAQADFPHLVGRVRRPALWAPARLPPLDKALNTL
ncbi:MAG TPA: TIGR03085 family protein, partial [Marmoricola sp.]